MHRFEEIQDLREAFAESPDNIPLLWILIRKMRVVKESHFELKPLVERMMIKFPDDLELKEILIEIYFYQEKFASSIVIWEDIDDIDALGPDSIVILSKCYLRLGNVEESKRLFLFLVEFWPGHLDREPEAFFRIPIKKFP